MKIEILAECVTALAECDVDNPLDQKKISVCENYIMESYKDYLESCELNDFEPLSEAEYIQELMLNEGFFKKLLGGLALAGAAAVGGKKLYNAANAYGTANGGQTGFKNMGTNLRNMTQASGGILGAAKNVARTSMKNDRAVQQYNGAATDKNLTTGKQSMNIASSKEAREAVNKGTDLTKTNTVSFNRHGQTKTMDANSERAKNAIAGQEKAAANAEARAQARKDFAAQQSAAAKAKGEDGKSQADKDKELSNSFKGNNGKVDAAAMNAARSDAAAKARQEFAKSEEGQAQQKEQEAKALEARKQADAARKQEETNNNATAKYGQMSSEERAAELAKRKAEMEERKKKKAEEEAAAKAKAQQSGPPPSPGQPVNEEWANYFKIKADYDTICEECELLDREIQIINEELINNKLTKPLTPAIRCSAKFI